MDKNLFGKLTYVVGSGQECRFVMDNSRKFFLWKFGEGGIIGIIFSIEVVKKHQQVTTNILDHLLPFKFSILCVKLSLFHILCKEGGNKIIFQQN